MPIYLLVKWEEVSPNSRYIGNFIMKLSGRWFPQIVDIGTVGIYIQYIYKTNVVLASELVGGRSRVTELPC